jgi:hypothetical protein
MAMKIVINRCFGGFGLSPRAEALFRRIEKVKPDDEASNEYFSVYDIPRDHPTLVKIVEKLGGSTAGGDSSELKIVEVPDDVNWYIEEYDGMEHVTERHRVWK